MSLDIKYIKDTEGNNYFPVVHEKGVVDDNGTTLESKLQSKQDAIGDIDTIRNKANSAIQSITIGTTTTGEAGSSANVINTGTATTPILSFTIPQGAQGIQGPTGPQGERGLPGESGVTGDVSAFTVIQTIDPSATYGATDIAGAATVQTTNQELTELGGKISEIDKNIVSEEIDNEVVVTDDDDNVVFEVNKNYVNAKNLRSNGTPVLTEYEIVNLSSYTNLRDCLETIEPSEHKRYIVNIPEGEYNIKSLFTAEEIAANNFKGLFIPDYVTLRGVGRKEYTILKWYNDDNDRSDLISVLNLRNVAGLENITVNGQNIRYAIHDDFAVRGKKDVKKCFNIDVNIYKGVYNAAWGAGQKGNQTAIFENCNFYTDKNNKAFSLHNNVDVTENSYIVFKNCTFENEGNFETLGLSSLSNNTTALTYVYLQNCKIKNGIRLIEENVSLYGAGIFYQVYGFGNNITNEEVNIINTDGVDYSSRINLDVSGIFEELKDLIDGVSSKYDDCLSRVETISTEDEIIVEDDNGNKVLVVNDGYVDAKNLKRNGIDVLTEHQDISGIVQDIETLEEKTESISIQDVIEANEEALVLSTDDNKVVSKISASVKSDVTDGFLITSDEYDEDNSDEEDVYLDVNETRVKAKKFEAKEYVLNGENIIKKNYFDDAQFIPDKSYFNTPDTIFYNGDTKVNNNFIVNAVAYPNGEMIACRRGGDVVKIAKDGTETVLLTLSGASDWRGVFMDKDLNVYVSPHASFDGSGLNMSDRGLYRLAYGQSTFTKVISLYNPSSQVQSETESNDDTIWTICQDKNGYLYAGVYSHTVRHNPAIYRSTDGGITWTYLYNFITSGVCTVGHHIHVVIYNEFDNKLYCIVGEKNEIYCSSDNAVTWVPLGVQLEYAKGSAMIAVKDGLIVGSDSGFCCLMSKVYTDKSHKTTGRMWANTVFAIRRSDVTGWLYAFTKIDSSVNVTDYMPPIEAISDAQALQDWIDSNPRYLSDWQKMYNATKDYYPEDCIRPQHCAILCSKDDGETWEIVYKKYVTSARAFGFPTTGYFRNGECLTGFTVNVDGNLKFTNPVIISEGKHKFTSQGLDISGDIFAKTLNNTIINV